MRIKGIILTAISAVLFGFSPVLGAFTYELGATPETVTFYRNLIAVPLLLVIVLAQGRDIRLPRGKLPSVLIIGIFGSGATTLLHYTSMKHIGVGSSTALHFLFPVFTALICRVLFGERLGWRRIVALGVSLTGVACFLEPGELTRTLGVVLAIASGLTYAFYITGIDKSGLKDMGAFRVSFYMACVVSIFMLVYNIPTQSIVFVLPPIAYVYLTLVAVCTSVVSAAFLQMGIKYLGASTAALFCLLEPVASMVSGRLFLGESITFQKAAGCALILAAVTVLTVASGKSKENNNIR